MRTHSKTSELDFGRSPRAYKFWKRRFVHIWRLHNLICIISLQVAKRPIRTHLKSLTRKRRCPTKLRISKKYLRPHLKASQHFTTWFCMIFLQVAKRPIRTHLKSLARQLSGWPAGQIFTSRGPTNCEKIFIRIWSPHNSTLHDAYKLWKIKFVSIWRGHNVILHYLHASYEHSDKYAFKGLTRKTWALLIAKKVNSSSLGGLTTWLRTISIQVVSNKIRTHLKTSQLRVTSWFRMIPLQIVKNAIRTHVKAS